MPRFDLTLFRAPYYNILLTKNAANPLRKNLNSRSQPLTIQAPRLFLYLRFAKVVVAMQILGQCMVITCWTLRHLFAPPDMVNWKVRVSWSRPMTTTCGVQVGSSCSAAPVAFRTLSPKPPNTKDQLPLKPCNSKGKPNYH